MVSEDENSDFLLLCLDPDGVLARQDAIINGRGLLRDIDVILERTLDGGGDGRPSFAVMLVIRVAVSLVDGIDTLLPGNAYAASALVRQLVEVEYLAWACAHDPDEAVDWLKSDSEARRKRWQPRHLRERSAGHFDTKDYADHCEAGGHPTPSGILTLNGATQANPEFVAMPEVTRYETVLHFVAICDYLTHALPDDLAESDSLRSRAHAISGAWRKADPVAAWRPPKA
ncbi:hypothetical protein [Lacisediminihabitans changchengi]|uniref:Uncharacterized protein n=1 Tax=Lacisediminihabitans changchengi TaxID=2787634 RepID=A0A934SLS0_9MICO|nr:hypothetical protein [Lacisediminihabitans changchengi]MBK4347680.1 hypothetical protein [Lacisediminihabitans changchengi]